MHEFPDVSKIYQGIAAFLVSFIIGLYVGRCLGTWSILSLRQFGDYLESPILYLRK